MNDEIDKINEINRKIDNPEKSKGDQSRAAFSNITTNEEDKKIGTAQRIIQDLGNQRADIDEIKSAIKQIAERINQITGVMNKTSNGTLPTQNQEGKGLNMETISAIGELFEKGAQAYKSLKGGQESSVDMFTQTIVDRSKQEAMQSLDIVSLINQKVKKTLVNDIAGDLASHIIEKDTHAPQ